MCDRIKAFEISLAARYGISQERERKRELPDFAKELLDYVNSPAYTKLIADEMQIIANNKKQTPQH